MMLSVSYLSSAQRCRKAWCSPLNVCMYILLPYQNNTVYSRCKMMQHNYIMIIISSNDRVMTYSDIDIEETHVLFIAGFL